MVIFIFNVQKLMAVWDEYFRWRLKLALTTHLTGVLQQNCLATLLSNNNRSTAAAVSVKSPLYSRDVVCNLCDVYQIELKIFFSHFCVIKWLRVEIIFQILFKFIIQHAKDKFSGKFLFHNSFRKQEESFHWKMRSK